ncbi:hypothetical protein K435DRAFT_805118 [Dendrothele bispora CBS 962.96]|uniref:Uncharacterized protein n=1 Tax=Dendrothele bispora (strain CBS 962.96) TaxID=1314807 RepID=A0A4S8LDI4_DENBC|nr:hypothetical protein K435DRAFT_805118 [Dendrothele bispora CBS 962.96]
MPSPFLLLRNLFFALMAYLSLLTLIFSSWNVNVTSSSGLSVPGSSVILILNSCLVFIGLSLGLAPLVWPQFNTAQIILECAWSAILSLLQIGAAISTTVVTSSVIRQKDNVAINASSFLLVPVTWLSSLCTLAHFFILFMSAMTHMQSDANIWSKSVYDIKWFGFSSVKLDASDVSSPRPKTGFEEDSWTMYLADIESSAGRKARYPPADHEKAPWAPTNVRRGRDAPFQAPVNSDTQSSRQSSPTPRANDALPPLPLRVEPKAPAVGSRFIERFRSFHFFPNSVDDHDQPIPLPRFSRWIRADGEQTDKRNP